MNSDTKKSAAPPKYIIIGAVAGGASAAARLRRMDEKANIILFEKSDYISYANCGLPYYIGDVIKERQKLFVQTAASFTKRFGIDVRIGTEVKSINTDTNSITATNLITGETYTETYDKLILSPGAEPVRPPLDGIGLQGIFTLRNVVDTDTIKSYVQKFPSGKAVIIGAGFIGLEMAENLHELGMQVSIIEMGNQVLAPLDFSMAAIVQQHIRSKGISLYLSTKVTGFEKDKNGLQIILNGAEALPADLVILSIGVKPDTRLAIQAGLKIGNAKGILVNEFLQTSHPDIYAVGDAIEFENPITGTSVTTFLAGPANKQGRICANNIVFKNTHSYKGSIGTAIVKAFDVTIGTTGLSGKNLAANGIPHLLSTTHSGSHAAYYPGAEQMSIQLVFAPVTGRLLGAQVVGTKGVDKRVDLLASVIKRGGNIFDLAEIEHAYAPPFSSAKDPVNIAGFTAENILLKRMNAFYHDEVSSLDNNYIIDVRSEQEYADGKINNAINIPLDDLRSRLNEIPIDQDIYVYCQIGLRGYIASRILMQNGFEKVYNLSGGYQLWFTAFQEKEIAILNREQKIESILEM